MSKTPTPYSAESLHDIRTVDRHLAEGRTTQEAFDAYLASLPDETEELVESELRFTVRGRPVATAGTDDDDQ